MTELVSVKVRKNISCYNCGENGHLLWNCLQCRQTKVHAVTLWGHDPIRLNIAMVEVNKREANALLDMGCELDALVNSSLVNDKDYTGNLVQVSFANGSKETLPVAEVQIKSDFIIRNVKASHWRFDLWLDFRVHICKHPSNCDAAVSTMIGAKDRKAEVTHMNATPIVSKIVWWNKTITSRGQKDKTLSKLWEQATPINEHSLLSPNPIVSIVVKRGSIYQYLRMGLEFRN